MDDGLKTAVKKIEEALQDDDAVRIYYKLEWDKMVRENEKIRIKKEKEEIRKKGSEEGEKKGKEKTKIEIATELKNMEIPIQNIAKATGLSEEFIEKL